MEVFRGLLGPSPRAVLSWTLAHARLHVFGPQARRHARPTSASASQGNDQAQRVVLPAARRMKPPLVLLNQFRVARRGASCARPAVVVSPPLEVGPRVGPLPLVPVVLSAGLAAPRVSVAAQGGNALPPGR